MYSEGREDVNDEERAGRPSTSTTDETINEVEKMILVNRRITVREVAEDLNISIGSCHSIFINDLGMRRFAAKFVPKLLNCDQKQNRMNIANEMLDTVRDDPNLLQRTEDGITDGGTTLLEEIAPTWPRGGDLSRRSMEMSTPANSTNLAILGLHPSAYKVRRTPVIKAKWDADGARGSERMWGQQTHGSWKSNPSSTWRAGEAAQVRDCPVVQCREPRADTLFQRRPEIHLSSGTPFLWQYLSALPLVGGHERLTIRVVAAAAAAWRGWRWRE
ncbi:hypothetical protein LAZ67_3001471 [Cordylochernes scorpioides]|uniref:Uncharacterized protein n=1 Tax=Cordylochernes scorpioides TaxID=51811 RepID=A0ABY6K8I6_9ARAC|nr:hypothetical protein LAZ67_3001471 [Cordylochernes scorpioides]